MAMLSRTRPPVLVVMSEAEAQRLPDQTDGDTTHPTDLCVVDGSGEDYLFRAIPFVVTPPLAAEIIRACAALINASSATGGGHPGNSQCRTAPQ